MDSSRLTALTNLSNLQALRDLYKRNWPKHCIGYYTLQNYINWLRGLQVEEIQNLIILTLNNDWQTDGLFLIVDRYQLFINSLTLDEERLAQALKFVDWSKGYKVTAIPTKYFTTVVSHVTELALNWDAAKMVIYHMPKDKALKFQVDCPADFQVRPLNPQDAATVNRHWASRHEGSLFFIKRLIELNLSMGLYKKDNQELVAWCTRCQAGFIGTLAVQNTYRRQGFACLIVKVLALQLAESGQDVLSLVYEGNMASHQLFLKLGFQIFDYAHHMKAFRSKKGIEWPEDS